MQKLTEIEEIAKQILEEAGWIVVKPNWPDFLIYTDTKPLSYCFVEVKRNVYDHVSKGQLETLWLLKKIGFPHLTFYACDKDLTLKEQFRNAKIELKESL
jgi:predicted nucleotidyltransferase